MLNSQSGIINKYLVDLGILEQGFAWLGNPNTAIYSVSLAMVWRLFPIFAFGPGFSFRTLQGFEHQEPIHRGGGSFRVINLADVQTKKH